MLKILIHQENLQILGVQAIGAGATELVHIGQAVTAFKEMVDYFINTVSMPTRGSVRKDKILWDICAFVRMKYSIWGQRTHVRRRGWPGYLD